VSGVGLEAWGWALAAFAGVFTVLFTTFLTHPHGLWDGVYTGLKYWLNQQPVGRGGEPKTFYGVLLTFVEWPALIFGTIGAVSLLRRRSLFGMFLVWDFLLSLAVYSWASEKFAWLVMHPLLPLLLLSGAGLQSVWRARGVRRYLGLLVAAVGIFYFGASSWRINFGGHGADPSELLVSTQSSTQVKQVAEQVLSLAASRGPSKPPLTVTVDAADGATFPYAWYFRHLSVGYIDESLPNAAPPTSDVVLLTDQSRTRLGRALNGYTGREYSFRVWWVRDYGAMSVKHWWEWIVHRKVWNPTGGMPEWLYIKKGV
jgi:predicted membrane-bound mannosyltransferase